MTAQPVPQEYRREKSVDQNQHRSEVGLPLRGPGAYSIRPATHGAQDENTNHEKDDDEEAMNSTNEERNESALLSDDPDSALEAQVVPERDLDREVQQKIEAITIDPIAVSKSGGNNDALNGPPSSLHKMAPMIILGFLMAMVAGGSAIGVLAFKGEKKTHQQSLLRSCPI
jgi:hypothetical protein